MKATSRSAMARQYGTDANLAARQALYRFRRPGPDFFEWALSHAALTGGERVVDAGCGNGSYLDRLGAGVGVGVDLSAGMAAAARARTGRPVAVGDIAALPLRSGWADVALCMHVLYHLPDQAAGVAELRRVLGAGGVAVVLTNSLEHLRELDGLVEEIVGRPIDRSMHAFTMEDGADVLRSSFGSVEPQLLRSAVDVTDAGAIVDYVASAPESYGVDDEHLAELDRRVAVAIERDGAFTASVVTGLFVCRSG